MRIEIADTLIKRTLGLMFREEGVIIFNLPSEKRWTIWTPFMKFDIDTFFFDSSKRLIERAMIKKWRIHRPKRPYKYLIESPRGKLTRGEAINLIKG